MKYEDMFSNAVIEHTPNKRGRDLVVGDIHGRYSDLNEALRKIGFSKTNDRLFSTGDLVDRGNGSHRVIEYLDEEWFLPVRGNHDELVIQKHYNTVHWELYGGDANWRSLVMGGEWWFNICEELQNLILERFIKIPIAREINYGGKRDVIVHADIPADYIAWDEIKADVLGGDKEMINYLQWSRDRITYNVQSTTDGVDRVFVGHSVVNKPMKIANVHYMDTGSGFQDLMWDESFYQYYKDHKLKLSIADITEGNFEIVY